MTANREHEAVEADCIFLLTFQHEPGIPALALPVSLQVCAAKAAFSPRLEMLLLAQFQYLLKTSTPHKLTRVSQLNPLAQTAMSAEYSSTSFITVI